MPISVRPAAAIAPILLAPRLPGSATQRNGPDTPRETTQETGQETAQETTQETTQETSDVGAVWTLAASLLKKQVSPARLHSLTGGIARTARDTLTWDDVHSLLVPGLTALQLETRFLPLPDADNEEEWERVSREMQQTSGAVLLHFSGPTQLPAEPHTLVETASDLHKARDEAKPVFNPTLIRQNYFESGQELRSPVLNNEAGANDQSLSEPTSRVLLTLRYVPGRAMPARENRAAIQRWLAFTEAFPARALSARLEDAPLRALAAEFLANVAGRARSSYAIRLRYAEGGLRQTTEAIDAMPAVWDNLRDAVCLELQLPASLYHALVTGRNRPVTASERRELIYLARAGTPTLKVLAASRLADESPHPDVRRTLEQFADEDRAWLRAFAADRA